MILDNRWVVPYNPLLCQLFDCHINVECSNGIHAVKYIFKYVHKGHDRCVAEIGEEGAVDEIKKYLTAR